MATVSDNMRHASLRDCSIGAIARRAVEILAVDDIHVSARGKELLAQCEAGTMTFAQARDDVIARARLMASKAASQRRPALFR